MRDMTTTQERGTLQEKKKSIVRKSGNSSRMNDNEKIFKDDKSKNANAKDD